MTSAQRGIRAAQIGVLVNAGLAAAKFAAGVLGNTYALVADAVESLADIFASLVVWGGLHLSADHMRFLQRQRWGGLHVKRHPIRGA